MWKMKREKIEDCFLWPSELKKIKIPAIEHGAGEWFLFYDWHINLLVLRCVRGVEGGGGGGGDREEAICPNLHSSSHKLHHLSIHPPSDNTRRYDYRSLKQCRRQRYNYSATLEWLLKRSWPFLQPTEIGLLKSNISHWCFFYVGWGMRIKDRVCMIVNFWQRLTGECWWLVLNYNVLWFEMVCE